MTVVADRHRQSLDGGPWSQLAEGRHAAAQAGEVDVGVEERQDGSWNVADRCSDD